MAKRTPSNDYGEDLIDLLKMTLVEYPEPYLQVGNIVGALGPRSFGVAILIFALPMIIPMPPGVPLTAGFVICIFAVQLILGRSYLWLPNWLAVKRIKRDSLLKAYEMTDQYLGWMFRLARPRLPQLTGSLARRVAGFVFAILSLLMILPIPFIGNILPAFACTVLALGLTDHDGLIYLVGVAFAGITISVTILMAIGTLNVLGVLF